MAFRVIVFLFVLCVSSYSQLVFATSCSVVFPAALQSNQLGSGNELINFPANNAATNITNGAILSRGDNFYSGSVLGNNNSISVGPITGSETTARVYFRTAISWQNVKINEFGNPEDLIIISDGSLSITGGNTVINAIIYVKGAVTINGNATINGSITSLGSANISGANINYQQSYITKANFNGMCTNTPAIFVDHYEIIHDGNGLTCDVEPITIKACTNASCSILNNNVVTLNLQGNGVTKSSPNFTGSTVVNISDPVAETLTLSINSPSITPSNATVCSNGSTSSCDVIFADTGFRFLVNGITKNIPTQLSGKPSNTGYHNANLSLQAVKTNTATGACEAALTNNVTIEIAAKCTNPTSCAGQQVNVNGTNISTINNAATLTYTNITANFGSNSNNAAPITLMYPDAGRIQLFPRYNIPVNGSPSGQYMMGSSNGFVVRPLGFYVNVIGNAAAQNATQGVFKKAGQAFSTTIKAVQWQLGDDTNNNAKPDSNALLSNNIVTPNFGHEKNPEIVILQNSLVAPIGGINPSLNNHTFSTFINGVQTRNDLSWDEVGILKFNASLSDKRYIGTSNVISTVPYVGRFIPDHLIQTVHTQGTLVGSCGAGNWVYSGEKDQATQLEGAISYSTAPLLRITAYNTHGSISADITQNYTTTGGEGFMRLLSAGINIVTPTSDLNQLGADGVNKTLLTGNITSGLLTQVSGGVQDYTLAATDDFTYTHNANSKISSYIAEIPLAISAITDQDGVTATTTEQAVPSGVNVRFGRLNLANSFGPETSSIAQPLTAQYLSSSGNFITNSDDNCTGYNAANITLSTLTLNKSLTGVNNASGMLSSGKNDAIVLQGVTAGTQGKVGVLYSTFPWLQYDWNNNGSYNDNPSAVATFGLFRGNDRVIYWREVNN